jgi:hypothetical protein
MCNPRAACSFRNEDTNSELGSTRAVQDVALQQQSAVMTSNWKGENRGKENKFLNYKTQKKK